MIAGDVAGRVDADQPRPEVFHSLHQWFREGLHDRLWRVAYAPPVVAAAVDHGTSWVTLAGLAIGFGGLSCHAVQTAIRVREHLAARPPRIEKRGSP